MRHCNRSPRGLILLVVLSMLTLFSLLAISYVVYSGQMRSVTFGIARRDHHGMKGAELLDEAMKQALRGTSDNISAVGPHALLADLYGYSESLSVNLNNLLFQAREPGELFAGRFLRVPLNGLPFAPLRGGVNITSQMASEHDAFTGRVLTFLNGPLSGVSFRIVRSVATIPAPNDSLQHSVVIDLDEAGPAGAGMTAATAPALCHNGTSGYQLWINARELNGSGYGIPYNFDGESPGTSSTSSSPPVLPGDPGITPFNLQPGLHPDPNFGGQIGAANARGLARGFLNASDTDEAYDAPDHNDFYLAHSRLPLTIPDPADSTINGLPGQDIIPSFHRAALVNYIINREDLTDTSSFTQDDFLHMLNDIQGACGRPLGISVVGLEGQPNYYSSNRFFDGSNPGSAISTPVLNINLGGSWNNWSGAPYQSFLEWARMLTGGPWDVDNDGDGIADSVWTDLDLPLITSSEGKLLKMMAAYYIEDLDNRLDLNAVGNYSQTTGPDFVANTGTNTNFTLAGTDLPQGFGLGPAEATLRHLFVNDVDWQTYLQARYGGANQLPGSGNTSLNFDDFRSRLDGGAQVFFGAPINAMHNAGTRSRRQTVRHDLLPGLPSAPRGDFAMGYDRLGNPLLLRGTTLLDQGTDDPYESQLLSVPHQDSPFSIAEWERIYRHRDWDRSSSPRRLEAFTPIVGNINAVTPRSSHTRHVPLAVTSNKAAADPQITNFREMLEAIRQFVRPSGVAIDADAYAELFPLEFKRAQAMDLNRPFGNGIDDDLDGSIDEPDEMLMNGVDDDSNSTVDEYAELNLFNAAGDDLNFAQRQQALYIAGNEAQRSGVSEFPVLSPTSASPAYYGYTFGNLDPDYEAFVSSALSGNAADRGVAIRHHGQQSRQLMARHLYCLAMLLLPDNLSMSNVPTVPLTGPERARAIAQWVVNIIDFRDADHVMTRFAYDPNPFVDKGGFYWLPNRDSAGSPTGDVVWGMEQPELLLTETGATHDLRIKDTADDDGPNPSSVSAASNPDNDYDQYRKPQGSLLLELMVPRTTSVATDSDVPSGANSLYTTVSGNRLLNLGAVTPSDGTTNYPVWRLAISQPHANPLGDVTTPTPNNIVNGTAQVSGAPVTRHDVSYQLTADTSEATRNGLIYDRPSAGRGQITQPTIDRLVWFTNQSNIGNVAAAAVGLPATVIDTDRPAHVYFNESSTSSPLLAGGQYLVVGPRQTTYFGSKVSAGTSNNNEPNDHRIDLQTNWANIFINPNTPVNQRATMRDIVSMTAVTTPPWNRTGPWNVVTTQPEPWVGLNVSEPHPTDTDYYLEPTHQLNSGDNTGDPVNGAPGFQSLPRDAYYDHAGAGTGANPDTPFDFVSGTPINDYYKQHHPETNATPAGVATPGTQLDWCTAFLQRLADPERPFHDTFNPYITVDWMPIDLTVFSGEDTIYTDAAKTSGSEYDATYQFGFRSKSGAIAGNRGRTFLSYLSDAPVDNLASTVTDAFFQKELPVDNADNSLPSVPQVRRPTLATNNFTTLGYLNSSFVLLNEPPSATVALSGTTFLGVPETPPANVQWHNRDFVSPLELMLVPLSAPGQLMQEFFAPVSAGDVGAADHYAGPQPTQQPNIFPHLPNFFQQSQDPNTPGTGLHQAYTLATLLELVTVPSPWSDSDKVIAPTSFNYSNPREVIMVGPLMPPYNRISQMREPGRVNINTLENVEVLRGLEWSYLNTTDRNTSGSSLAFNDLKISRDRAYDNPIGTEQITGTKRNTHLDGNYPTEFPGVFKSSLAAGRVAPTAGVLDQAAILSPAQATIYRQSPASAATNHPRPLFSPFKDLVETSVPNPQAEYLPFSRLANLTTTRSNVFAVRITVGYFEYDSLTGIGPEYGWDNGQSRRHRGFYVIDRSIPVAYEPGQDLNTGNCVLVRRIVE